MKAAAILLAGLMALSVLPGVMPEASAQTVYKWVDADGITHFSTRPPRGVPAEATPVRLQRSLQSTEDSADDSSAPSPELLAATELRKQQTEEQAAEDAEVARQNAEMQAAACEKAKARVETYTNARRLYKPLENGEREYLTDDELDAERAKAQREVKELCG